MPSSVTGQSSAPGSDDSPGVTGASISGFSGDFELIQIYSLIDSILPFEACLYYQVLPLSIEGTRLVVGMVDVHDYGAESYVRRQLSFINYSVSTRAIDAEWHRELLSKYLSYTAKHRQEAPPTRQAATKTTTPSAQKAPPPVDSTPTYVVDQTVVDKAEEWAQPEGKTLIESEGESATPEAAPTPTNWRDTGGTAPLHLSIDAQYIRLETEALRSLQPKGLMQALLGRILQEGIGRLYFERQEQSGRIIWSRDGVLQATLTDVSPTNFQGVINEIKLLTHLSLVAVNKPRQVEIERLYEEDRILLRFRVMPGKYGEEATLQVLRGTALRFYQQQQMDKMGRDALDAADVLQRRLNIIRDRARQTLNFIPSGSETLPAIITMLRQVERQVQEMIATYEAELKKHKSS